MSAPPTPTLTPLDAPRLPGERTWHGAPPWANTLPPLPTDLPRRPACRPSPPATLPRGVPALRPREGAIASATRGRGVAGSGPGGRPGHWLPGFVCHDPQAVTGVALGCLADAGRTAGRRSGRGAPGARGTPGPGTAARERPGRRAGADGAGGQVRGGGKDEICPPKARAPRGHRVGRSAGGGASAPSVSPSGGRGAGWLAGGGVSL